ncbi:MAG: hypothetical protein RLP44_24690 [Aggregatilineales bacterium]
MLKDHLFLFPVIPPKNVPDEKPPTTITLLHRGDDCAHDDAGVSRD